MATKTAGIKIKKFPKNLKRTAHLKKPTQGKAKMLLKYAPDFLFKGRS